MIATRLHVKRHSFSTIHQPSVTKIRYLSYRQSHRRATKLPPCNILDIDGDSNADIDEVYENSKVETFSFY